MREEREMRRERRGERDGERNYRRVSRGEAEEGMAGEEEDEKMKKKK
jgi:hypothetical protein